MPSGRGNDESGVSKPRNWSISPDFPKKKTKRTWKQLSWTPLSFEPWQTCKILQVFGKSNQNSLASRACCSSALSFSKWCISSGIHFNWAVVEELHEASEGKFGSEPSTERWLLTSRFTLLKVWKLNNAEWIYWKTSSVQRYHLEHVELTHQATKTISGPFAKSSPSCQFLFTIIASIEEKPQAFDEVAQPLGGGEIDLSSGTGCVQLKPKKPLRAFNN